MPTADRTGTSMVEQERASSYITLASLLRITGAPAALGRCGAKIR